MTKCVIIVPYTIRGKYSRRVASKEVVAAICMLYMANLLLRWNCFVTSVFSLFRGIDMVSMCTFSAALLTALEDLKKIGFSSSINGNNNKIIPFKSLLLFFVNCLASKFLLI